MPTPTPTVTPTLPRHSVSFDDGPTLKIQNCESCVKVFVGATANNLNIGDNYYYEFSVFEKGESLPRDTDNETGTLFEPGSGYLSTGYSTQKFGTYISVSDKVRTIIEVRLINLTTGVVSSSYLTLAVCDENYCDPPVTPTPTSTPVRVNYPPRPTPSVTATITSTPTLTPTTTPTTTPTPTITPSMGVEWTQLGSDIDGITNEENGNKVCLSGDGNILAISSRNNSILNIVNTGIVRVYYRNGNSWIQLGEDIYSGNQADFHGWNISLNYDGTILAITAYTNGGNGYPSQSGIVKIYAWNGTSWIQRGDNIYGNVAGDQIGRSVCLNNNGNILAIGGRKIQTNTADSGTVIIYAWNGSSWAQRGGDIYGESAGDYQWHSISLSGDGNIVAIGTPYNDGNGVNSGSVRVYYWNGNSWIRRGGDIDGEAAGDQSGYSVSLSDNGNVLAIGALYNAGNGSDSGSVRVYYWNGNSWVRLGGDIDGEAAYDRSGNSISLNGDGTILAIGAKDNNGLNIGGSNSGGARVYLWSGNSWSQRGNDLNGDFSGDGFGFSVSLSKNGNILAIGAPFNDGGGSSSGTVKVYCWSCP